MKTRLLRAPKLSAVLAASLIVSAAVPALAQNTSTTTTTTSTTKKVTKAATPKPGEYKTEADAKAQCGTDTVVWVNTRSNKYHFAGNSPYGNTKKGAYECEKQAQANGAKAVKGEKHP